MYALMYYNMSSIQMHSSYRDYTVICKYNNYIIVYTIMEDGKKSCSTLFQSLLLM